MRRLLVWLPLAAFAGLAAVLALGLRHDPAALASPLVGRPAPAFSLPALPTLSSSASPAASSGAAGPVTPAAWRGRPWVLNVFASWCGGCRDEHALLMHVAREPGVRLVGLDYKDRPADAQAWLAGAGNPYAVVARDDDGRTGIDYGVYGVPETFVIDAQGVVRLRWVGALTEAAWNEHVRPWLQATGEGS